MIHSRIKLVIVRPNEHCSEATLADPSPEQLADSERYLAKPSGFDVPMAAARLASQLGRRP